MKKVKPCVWIWDEYHDAYDTSCGEDFCLTDGENLKENKIKFCCFCGKPIKEKR